MIPEPAPSLTFPGFPVAIEIPIWWGDQDAFGHVNNTIPMRWFESSRIAYMGVVGLSSLMDSHKVGPILASVKIDYRRHLHFPDSVTVGARVTRIGRTSLTMEHAAVSKKLGATAVEGTSTIVVFDYKTHRPEPVPETIRQAIAELEGRDFSAPPRD